MTTATYDKKLTARIWWDDQDSDNEGWAWTTRYDGDHDNSGPLDTTGDDTDADLIAALHREVSDKIDPDNIEIIR